MAIPPEFRQKIIDAKSRGETMTSIADRFEVSYTTVNRICKQSQHDDPMVAAFSRMLAHRRTKPTEIREKVVDARLRGEAFTSIAKRFELPYSTVYGIWKKFQDRGTVEVGRRGGGKRKAKDGAS